MGSELTRIEVEISISELAFDSCNTGTEDVNIRWKEVGLALCPDHWIIQIIWCIVMKSGKPLIRSSQAALDSQSVSPLKDKI